MTNATSPEINDSHLKTVRNIVIETATYIEYFKQLFCHNQNRIDIMNDSASTFFVLCRNSIVESIIMRLSKLTDPAKSMGHPNLSFRTLLHNIVPNDHEDYQKIEAQIEELENHLKTVRDKRRKHLGHLDLDSLEKKYPIPLAEIEAGMEAIDKILNALIQHYAKNTESRAFDNQTSYTAKPIHTLFSDARAVLIMLERGRRFKKMVQELPNDCCEKLIPDDAKVFGKRYFQNNILKYIDAQD